MPENAGTYHDLTSYDRHAMSPHMLDWANQPSLAKAYENVETIPLPQVSFGTGQTGADIFEGDSSLISLEPISSVKDMARALSLACGPTAVMRHASGRHTLRSNPSAGALYPTEAYFACRGVRDIKDGLFHYDPMGTRLHLLRNGDLLPELSDLIGFPSGRGPAVCFFLSAIIFRSAWKYRARSYRYHLLDTGHVIEGLVLALRWLSCPGTVGLDFDDDDVNRLLGLDPAREIALAGVAVCRALGERNSQCHIPPLPGSVLKGGRVSAGEVDYPAVREIHEAGKPICAPAEEPGPMVMELGPVPDEWISPARPPVGWQGDLSYPEIAVARRSRRNFVPEHISAEDFSILTSVLCGGMDKDRSGPARPDAVLGTGMLVGRVEGTQPGIYLLDPRLRRIGLVLAGDHTSRMARICLDQAWLAGAALHVVFMADMDILDRTWGPRGYRYAMLAAGRLAHRVYLAATALGLGCCGIGAFYDAEAAELLMLGGPSRLLYLVAAGPVQGGLRP